MTAATAKLGIVNLALSHLNEESTDTLSADEARNVVRKMLPFVDMARDLVLSAHGWQEALEYRSLSAAAGEAGDFRYPYLYWLAADCLRIWEVDTPGVRWTAGKRQKDGVERHVIRADTGGGLDVVYVRRLGWDGIGPQLGAAVAMKIAAMAAGPIQGDESRARALNGAVLDLLRAAAGRDGQQQGGQPVPFPSRLLALRLSAG